MIKILFLINTLGGGGAERVLVNLVNSMDKTKFDITIETMFADGINKEFLTSDIRCISKNKLGIRGLSNLIKYIPASLLYKYYIGKNNYDIIVAYMHGAPTKVISGCKEKDKKKVTWLHYGNPEKGTFFDFWLSRKRAFEAYDSMDAVVGVSKSVSSTFAKYTKIEHNKYTLYNTNDTEKIINMSNERIEDNLNHEFPIFCTSGRLTTQKGFDRLVSVSKKLFDNGYKFTIIIMGAGPDEEKLKMQIKQLNAGNYVKMFGFCANPYSIMKQCDAYISSSREEGLATVLTEALTLGMPVISTDVSGAKEVLGNNNEYGLVVENSEQGIYDGLKTFLIKKELRDYYRSVAQERAILFNTENTVSKTERFFEKLLNK